jgi:hypothetical protein
MPIAPLSFHNEWTFGDGFPTEPVDSHQAGFWPTQCQLRVSSSSSSAWM